jgi:serine/threonine protein kinase
LVKVPETFYIKVPIKEKDEAKSLGAKWDVANKLWYIPSGKEITNFSKWLAFLNVSYDERGIVKKQGAKWHNKIKKWYVEDPREYISFKKWWPTNRFNSLYQSVGEISLINERYERIPNEGDEGGTATVLICKDTKRDNIIVALKFYDPTKKDSNIETAETVYKREIMALQDLEDHPNILQILDNDFCKEVGMYYTVVEYAPFNLSEIIGATIADDEPDSLEDYISLIEPIASAMKYAHEKKWVHRDIKPANIVLSLESITTYINKDLSEEEEIDIMAVKDIFQAIIDNSIDEDEDEDEDEVEMKFLKDMIFKSTKICDFGISRLKDFSTASDGVTLRDWRSEPWSPPHDLGSNAKGATSKKSFNNEEPKFSYDVWSIGAVFLAIYDRAKFHPYETYGDLNEALGRLEKDKSMPNEIKELLNSCLDHIALERPKSAIEVYSELQKIKKKYLLNK